MAALIAARPGAAGRARLIYRTHLDRGSGRHRRKGLTETDYARLLDAAHQQLHRHIVLIWDNLPTHTSRAMRQLIEARSWLTVYQRPPEEIRRNLDIDRMEVENLDAAHFRTVNTHQGEKCLMSSRRGSR